MTSLPVRADEDSVRVKRRMRDGGGATTGISRSPGAGKLAKPPLERVRVSSGPREEMSTWSPNLVSSARPLIMDVLDLRPLHQVYQTLDPATTEPLAHPLVCISELRRRPPPKRSARATSAQVGSLDGATELGEVEWVLMIGGEGLVKGEPEQKSKKKLETGPEEWWKACLCGREVEELMKQVSSDSSSSPLVS